MENETKMLLQEGKSNIINMREKRKSIDITDNLVIKDLLKKANDYSLELNRSIIIHIFYTYLKSVNNRIMRGIQYAKEYISLHKDVITVDNLCSSKSSMIYDTFYKYREPEILEFLKEYNEEHSNPIVFLYEGYGEATPAILNKSFFEELGFAFNNVDYYISITGNIEANEELVRRIMTFNTDDINCDDIYDDIVYDYLTMLRKETKIKNYTNKSLFNLKLIILEVCKKILSNYKKDAIIDKESVITTTIPCIYNNFDINANIDEDELDTLKVFKLTCNNQLPVIFVYYKKWKKYLPIIEKDLNSTLKELCSDYVIDNEKNRLIITTNVSEFEKLVLNIDQEKTKAI